MPTLEKEPTPRVLRVFEATEREAERYGHEYIATEHLLLGLLAEPNGIAAKVLSDLGVAHEISEARPRDHGERGLQRILDGVILPAEVAACGCAAFASLRQRRCLSSHR